MHLLRNSAPIDTKSHGVLPPGEWLCSDLNAAQLLVMSERGASTLTHCGQRGVTGEDDSIVFLRSGAIGDLLFASPAFARLKEMCPTARIALSCFPQHHEVVCDLGIELLPYPLPLETAKEFSTVVSLEDVMELHPNRHATDCFANELGVVVSDYRPQFQLSELEKQGGLARHPKTLNTRLGVQCLAQVPNRSYPMARWVEVFQLLTEYEIFLFGSKGQVPDVPLSNVVHLTKNDLTFRQSAAVLATCDVFCGIDSSLLHLCHALDIPAVGLFAAFDWKSRTSKAPLTWALTGVGECAPCNWHKHAGQAFPPNAPCSKVGHCTVLTSIEPKRIAAKIKSLPHATKTTAPSSH